MEVLEPLVNLLIVLTALSMVAERLTNLVKLDSETLRTPNPEPADEKRREQGIVRVSLMIGVLVAVAMKANMFEMLAHLDAPWDTLGWVTLDGNDWRRAPATANAGMILYSIGGSIITGLGLSFGSKFWHELLDGILELRRVVQRLKERPPAERDGGREDGGRGEGGGGSGE